SPERLDAGGDGALDGGRVGDVAVRAFGHAAGVPHLGDRLCETVAVDVDGEDLGPFRGEEPRGRTADAGSGAGDEDDALGEATHHPPAATRSSTGAIVASSRNVLSITAVAYSSGVPATASRGITT